MGARSVEKAQLCAGTRSVHMEKQKKVRTGLIAPTGEEAANLNNSIISNEYGVRPRIIGVERGS